MFFFLQGQRLVGKSSLLRDALLPYEARVAGFLVQRLYENGAPCGYRACAVGETLPPLEYPYAPALDNVFLYNGATAPHILDEAITKARCFCEADRCKFIILDEVGGMELLRDTFMEQLTAILSLGKPCFGVIKSRENLAETARNLGLPAEILARRDALHRLICRNGAVHTLTVKNRNQMQNMLAQFMDETMNNQREE